MMTWRGLAWALVLVLTCAARPPAAVAVIRVDIPVSKVYDTATAVMAGTVTGLKAGNRLLEVKITETFKGKSPGGRVRVQIAAPAELFGRVVGGGSVLVFAGKHDSKPVAVVHLADTWLLAEGIPNVAPPTWRVWQVHDIKQSFPGRTAALVRVVAALKAGKSIVLDKIDHEVFRGGVRKLAKLKVAKPRFCLACDVNGDKKPDLLIGTAGGCRLFLATADGYEDVTARWANWPAPGGYRAFGDVNGDGRCDLLLDETLWVNEAGRFRAAKAGLRLPPNARPLAAAIADATGDKRPDVLLLAASGELRVFENPGSTLKSWPPRPARTLWQASAAPVMAAFGDWGDDGKCHVLAVRSNGVTRYAVDPAGGPPADHERLTGRGFDAYHKAHRGGLKNILATPIDINGDRRTDFFVYADGGALLLVNRGLGAFLVNPDPAGAFTARGQHRPPFKLGPGTCWTAADVHGDGFEDLLVLTADGTLYEVNNTPFARP